MVDETSVLDIFVSDVVVVGFVAVADKQNIRRKRTKIRRTRRRRLKTKEKEEEEEY